MVKFCKFLVFFYDEKLIYCRYRKKLFIFKGKSSIKQNKTTFKIKSRKTKKKTKKKQHILGIKYNA